MLLDALNGGHLALAGMVALIGTLAAPKHAHIALGLAVAAGGMSATADAILPGVALAAAGAALHHDGPRVGRTTIGTVLIAVAGVGSLYACVPDTERARALLGATAAGALVVVVDRGRWRRSLVGVSAAVAVIAVLDGSPRHSSQLAGVGIAVLLATGHFGAAARLLPRLVVGLGVLALLSRVVGLSTSPTWPPLAAIAAATLGIAATRLLAGGAPAEPGPDHWDDDDDDDDEDQGNEPPARGVQLLGP